MVMFATTAVRPAVLIQRGTTISLVVCVSGAHNETLIIRERYFMSMTLEEHKARHVELHKKFDELLADFIYHTGAMPSTSTLKELIDWSYDQTINPSDNETRSVCPDCGFPNGKNVTHSCV
jgi:hypothetical protein